MPERLRRGLRTLLVLLAAAATSTTLVMVSAPTAQALPPSEFLARYAADAQAGEREHGVPASVALAQAALESGWGESSLTKEGNAFFGIKCSSDNGPYSDRCVTKRTQECNPDGSCFTVTAQFRGYADHADSFRDHGHFLRSRDRYAAAFGFQADPDRFIIEVHRAGYATDPNYSDKIISLMQRHDMYRFNVGGGGGGGTPARPVIREGDQGTAVRDAQQLLNAKGRYGLAVDGRFGPATLRAVRDFQSRNDLQVDGVVGPATWAVLDG